MIIPLSILDLAPIRPGQSATDSFAASVALAQHAEEWGYRRVWYAEHHNMPTIASSATSVLIAHVAVLTRTIRLAPGSDQNTMRALRRYVASADTFPEDVLELQGYLAGETRIPGVDATPGKGTHVPLYILGSSLFGANLAALLGLPFAFASHFAPDALQDAVAAYRREFRPSAQLEQPFVMAGVNVIAADTSSEAQEQHLAAKRNRVRAMLGRGRSFTDEEADMILRSPAGQHVQQMFRFAAVGSPAEVSEYIDAFARFADADELIVAHQSPTTEARLRSVALLADTVMC